MNRKTIKMHKGTDNEVVFRALDPNNTPVSLCSYHVYIRVFDGQKQILEHECQLRPRAGVFSVNITEGDLADILPGYYKAAIVASDSNELFVTDQPVFPLFTDFASNAEFTVEVTQQAERQPEMTYTINETNWTELRRSDRVTGYTSEFFSSSIPANRTRNNLNSVHSYSVHAENYTGRLYVYGTLDETPSTDGTGWFIIDTMESNEDYIQFIQYTGVRHFSFVGNFMWVRFVYSPDDLVVTDNGDIKRISVRF